MADSRRRRRPASRWAAVVTTASLLALVLVTGGAPPPVAADGNEAPGAPAAARSISGGAAHTCAILPSGRVKCWGLNTYGQLGQGSQESLGDQAGEMATLDAIDLGAGRTATAISAGNDHTCALLDNGAVKCWGRGANGRLGQESTANIGDAPGEMGDALPPVNLGAGRTATAVTAGNTHTCALLDNATTKCWGYGNWGQLGQDSTVNLGDSAGEMAALGPIDLGAGRTATAITASDNHTCALLDDGTIKCWGSGADGRLGQNSTTHLGSFAGSMAALPPIDLGVPLTVRLVANARWVAPGEDVDYDLTVVNDSAETVTGVVVIDTDVPDCAGPLANLAPGATTTINCSYPTTSGDFPSRSHLATLDTDQTAAIPSNLLTVAVAHPYVVDELAGASSHTCAVVDTGDVVCFGSNSLGTLGLGNATPLGDQPGDLILPPTVDLGTGRHATSIATGGGHSCAVLDDASLKCWGFGGSGRTGYGNEDAIGDGAGEMGDALPAVDLGTGRTATVVGAGSASAHTCALLDDGGVKCWGLGGARLGQGNAQDIGNAPGEMGDALPEIDLGTCLLYTSRCV